MGGNKMLSYQFKLNRFLGKARKKHGDKYDYSKVHYIDPKTNIIIICPIHGEITQTPASHLKGSGCRKCGIVKRGKDKRLGRDKFIEKACLVHGKYYDYSEVIYVRNTKKVIIICPVHGDFTQAPANHLQGQGCKLCGIDTRTLAITKTTEEFIADAKRVHGDFYCYDRVDYKDAHENVNISCPEHFDFPQSPSNHLAGKGCPSCGVIKRAKKRLLTNKEFFEKAISVHGFRYDYSQVEYRGNDKLVSIVCRDHGPFDQLPHNHWNGKGCKDCGMISGADKRRLKLEEFLVRAEKVHGDYYNYSKVEYETVDKKVIIICPVHGEFKQRAEGHWRYGCEDCGYIQTGVSQRLGTSNFIEKAIEVHGNLYDYSEVEYSTTSVPVSIACKIHASFYQTPNSHLQGSGCPSCKNKAEGKILKYLQEFVIVKHQFRLEKLAYDFYLPEYNLIIERDGEQHYSVVAAWTKTDHETQMQTQQEKDRKRTDVAKANGFKIARIPYWLSDKHSAYCTELEKREIANILDGMPSYPDIPILEHSILKPMPK